MSKYITHFQTESEYQTALPSIELPNVSLVDELGEVHYHRALYGAHTGDICLYDVAEGQKFFVTANDWNLTSYPTASYPIIGVAVADESVTGCKVVSILNPDTDGSQTKTATTYSWYNSGTNIDFETTTYNSSQTAATDLDGKSNTLNAIAKIKAYDLANGTDNVTGNIVDILQKYAPTGTNAGDWYIPSGGEILAMYATNRTVLNTTFYKIYNANSALIYDNYFISNAWSSTSSSWAGCWYALNEQLSNGSDARSNKHHLRLFTII